MDREVRANGDAAIWKQPLLPTDHMVVECDKSREFVRNWGEQAGKFPPASAGESLWKDVSLLQHGADSMFPIRNELSAARDEPGRHQPAHHLTVKWVMPFAAINPIERQGSSSTILRGDRANEKPPVA